MIGHYVPKEIRDVGLAGFGLAAVLTGSLPNQIVAVFAIAMAAGATVAAINRIPDVVAELNGGVALFRRKQ